MKTLEEYPMIERHLKYLSEPKDIKDLLKKYKVGSFIYEFSVYGIVLKYGMSMNKSREYIRKRSNKEKIVNEPGERLYRQIAHLDGWPRLAESEYGEDILKAVEKWEKEHPGYVIHKDNVTVRMWDLGSNLEYKQVKQREASVIQEYHLAHRRMPYGNLEDYTPFLNYTVPVDFDKNFTVSSI